MAPPTPEERRTLRLTAFIVIGARRIRPWAAATACAGALLAGLLAAAQTLALPVSTPEDWQWQLQMAIAIAMIAGGGGYLAYSKLSATSLVRRWTTQTDPVGAAQQALVARAKARAYATRRRAERLRRR